MSDPCRLAVLGGLLWLAATPHPAAAGSVSFDDPVTSTTADIGVRYSNQGVLLPKGAVVLALAQKFKSAPHSAPNVLVSRAWDREFDTAPLKIQFTYKLRGVSLYTGVPWREKGREVRLRLEAFDAGGQRVASVSKTVSAAATPANIDVLLSVADPHQQHTIQRAELYASTSTGVYEFLDDLTLDSEGPPPKVATEPPQVHIQAPLDGTHTATGALTVSGVIVGDGLYPDYAPPTLLVSWPTAPASTVVSAYDYDMQMNTDLHWTSGGGGAAKSVLAFSLPYQLAYFGRNTVTVSASNAKGKASDQVSVTYFPKPIAGEYNKNPGAFGPFVWGTTIDGCSFAVYQTGAVFSSSAGTYSVFGPIFAKWQSLPASAYFGMLGCATGSEKPVLNGTSQDFEHGRVYSGPKGAFYVTDPFRDALDKLDFVQDFGLPVTDPVDQQKLLRPRRWQKFERTLQGVTFASAMELTDNPLTLWTATPDLHGAKRAGVQPRSSLPTVWRSFACSQWDQPCSNVSPPASVSKLPYDALVKACDGGHYPWGEPQWAPLAPTAKIVPYLGTAKSSQLSGEDATWNHDCSTGGLAGVDWCLHLVPDPGYEGLLGDDTYTQGRTVGVYPQDTLEIEYEWCLVGYPFAKDPNDPSQGAEENIQPGNKLFVAGRWISDCGCHPWYSCDARYSSEIHPPAVLLNMYTGTEAGQPATVGEIVYLDWWYPGQSAKVDLQPPPRPSADALLAWDVPLWKSFCPTDQGKCGLATSAEPQLAPNHVRVTVSGRPDVTHNVPPQENSGDGQLYHGCAPPVPPARYVCPYAPHDDSLWGAFTAYWTASP